MKTRAAENHDCRRPVINTNGPSGKPGKSVPHIRCSSGESRFNEMHLRCRTEFYIQVDEDMLLFPHAVQALRTSIASASRNVWSSCASLWDCDAQRAIYGVKIYRLSIVKVPYSNTPSCEIEQVAGLRAAGYEELLQPLDFANCLGEHGKHYSPETIFKRWQRCFQKHRLFGNMQWIEPYPRVLLDRYVKTGEILHL
jgi:hypothetical protein